MTRTDQRSIPTVAERWQQAFLGTVTRHRNAEPLKEAALAGHLGEWTQALTSVAVDTCEALGWRATAKGHRLALLPVPRSEYLSLDVVAFAGSQKGWQFPHVVLELENSASDDYIAYSLWKVLCVRAPLRVVFCYRETASQRSALIDHLRRHVVGALDVADRARLRGQTLLAVGTRADAATFPYGFFRWFELERNTGQFVGR